MILRAILFAGTLLCRPAAALDFEASPKAVVPEPAVIAQTAKLPGADAAAINLAIPAIPTQDLAQKLPIVPTQQSAAEPKPEAALPQTAAAVDAPALVFDGAARPRLTPAQWVEQGAARVKLLALRAATLPTHAWPIRQLANRLAHGEALAGLRPQGAARAAVEIHSLGGAAVVGRLSWELHDVWSVRGAVRSYLNLIDSLVRSKNPNASVSLDVEALGAQLDGVGEEQRVEIARQNALMIARRAKAAGIPIEFDVGAWSILPALRSIAMSVAVDLRMPVRLALAARYPASEDDLEDWARLAAQTGLRLGVRLVKGSFIESDVPGASNERRPLLERYKRLVTKALEHSPVLDVAVATHNEEIWEHARTESKRLGATVEFHVIRGVNSPLQERMREGGGIKREYVSYGLDTPVMGLMEAWTNWRHRRALEKRGIKNVD